MRVIHTADWHLGQNFYEYDRKTEHLRFMTWLKEVVREYHVDVLLIAGDVFDSPNPSAESQKMYYAFLREITAENPHLQVIIIAGNHDSAARLEAPNPLLEEMNVCVRGLVKHREDGEIDYTNLLVPLLAGGYCLAVPYLRQGDYPDMESYSTGVKALYDRLLELAKTEQGNKPIIAMGHLHTTGAELSENDRSERAVIGGLECVLPDTFSDSIAYTALGHIHRCQRVSGRDNVRYAGAPIPMSFSEKNNRQGVVLVEINDDTTGINDDTIEKNDDTIEKNDDRIRIERIIYEGAVEMLSVPREPASLEEALQALSTLPNGEITDASPFLEIKILLTEPEPSMRKQIEETLKGKAVRLARIAAVTPAVQRENVISTLDELQQMSPMTMAERVFEQQYGGAKMPEAMRKLLQEIIREVER